MTLFEFSGKPARTRGAMPGLDSFIDEVLAGLLRPGSTATAEASTAYALYRIAAARGDGNLAAQAGLNLKSDETTPESHAIRALLARGRGDAQAFESSLEGYLAAIDQTGRSGIRLLCQLLAAVRGSDTDKARPILEAGSRQMAGLWQELATQPVIGDSRGPGELGAAKGWAGLLYATMQWSAQSDLPLPGTLEDRLDQLARFAAKTSAGIRWPDAVKGSFENQGWCAGGAGHVQLWTLAHAALQERRWLRLAEETARENALRLSGPFNLCCGLAGQAYAQLTLYRHTGELEWLRNAHLLADTAIGRCREQRGRRDLSLYQGDSGLAVLAAELARPDRAAMPLVEPQPLLGDLAL